ncbi:MAG TPA: MauE/DoxX family redox-associated membrane protein, partial [Gemmataceae bacterium]|nr:MauE/DoxX family redox-associated membrane protein [Gemmataceae bacterium]
MTELRSRAFVAIRVVLGFLLLAAASLKIYGWSVSTVPPVGWFSTPSVQAVAVGWEILLSLWLLSRFALIGSWLTAIITFVSLAGISGYLGWIGQATCDCFGAIQASPWLAFGVDLAALLMLLSVGPSLSEKGGDERKLAWRETGVLVCFVLGVGVMLAALMGIGAWIYGSPAKAWARLRDEPLTVAPDYVYCGEGKPGEKLKGTVRVYNWTHEPVLIYGGTSDCSCVATAGLPVTIPPNGNGEIPLSLRLPESKASMFTRRVELKTNCKEKRTIKLRIGCRVK